MIRELVLAAAGIALGYFVVLNTIYVLFTLLAWRQLARHLRARRHDATEEALSSPLTPAVSVLLPAFDEEASIVESVRSLLALRYPRFEVIVVNDGSRDTTLERLREAFDLVPARRALRGELATAPVRGSYVSRRHPDLWVLDKENGGKADALNAGVDTALHPYVCAVDADAIIEEDALLRVARPILEEPDLVAATGGIVRIANGCAVDHGRVVEVGLPRSRLATLQVVEYFRAFLIGRVGWSRLNALLIISGAFGLFRRSLVTAVGGYWPQTVGEDAELVVRLHRHLRSRGDDYRIAFVPDPVCWTQAPEDIGTLSRQRRRWQRGLGQTLWRHRTVIGRPGYGAFGLVALPYFLLFEFLGPIVEVLGPPATLVFWSLGQLSVIFLVAFLVVAFLLGMLLSVSALALEELSFRRHPRRRDVLRLMGYSVVENLGYRQLNDVWRLLAIVDVLRRRQGWGAQRRRGFAPAAPAAGRVLRRPGGAERQRSESAG